MIRQWLTRLILKCKKKDIDELMSHLEHTGLGHGFPSKGEEEYWKKNYEQLYKKNKAS